jgi:hypothetical protein
MRRVIRCVLFGTVALLLASCETQRQKDAAATEPFKRFAAGTEGRLRAAVLPLTPYQQSQRPGAGRPTVEVAYDVKRSMSTVTPDDYSAKMTVSLQYGGRTASVTAEYTFTKGKWHTGEIGDTRPFQRHLRELEERARTNLLNSAGDKSDEEKRALLDHIDSTSLSGEISAILQYSDGEPKPPRK